MYITYALYNKQVNKIYVGCTKDLRARLKRHNKRLPFKKTGYTAKFMGRWKVIHKEKFQTRQEAKERERQLKTARGRRFIWQQVKARWM